MQRLRFFIPALAMMVVAEIWPLAAVQAQDVPAYRITRSVSLGGPDRWDYVIFDEASHRVYVAHGDRVSVVEGDTGAILGNVKGFPGGTHGIAIATATGRGYTDDGRAGIVASFDLSTFKRGKNLKAEKDADGMLFDPVSQHVFVVDGDSGKLTVIDPKTDSVIATVNVGSALEFLVSGVNGKIYVNGEANHEIVRIDTGSNQVDARWPMPGCSQPKGLAIDTVTHKLFSSCINSVLIVVDAESGAVVATTPIGRGSDAVAFDRNRKLVFSSNGDDGTISIIRELDAQTFVPAGTVKTALTGRTMDVNPGTGRLYVAAADIDEHAASAHPGGRPPLVPGSLKLLFLDPER